MNDDGTQSNKAYKDKASMIALYSYLLQEKAIRDPSKKYLIIAEVNEAKSMTSGKTTAAVNEDVRGKLSKHVDK